MKPIEKLQNFFRAKTVSGTRHGETAGARPLLAAIMVGAMLFSAVPGVAEAKNTQPAGRHEVIGTVVGAGAGGVVGHQFGKGKGKWATTAIGVLVGGIVGDNIGRRLDGNDWNAINEAGSMAVELPLRKKVEWYNSQSGRGGYVTTTAHWLTQDGKYFREIKVHTDHQSGGDLTAYAFKSPVDGAWHMAQPVGGTNGGNQNYNGRIQGRIR